MPPRRRSQIGGREPSALFMARRRSSAKRSRPRASRSSGGRSGASVSRTVRVSSATVATDPSSVRRVETASASRSSSARAPWSAAHRSCSVASSVDTRDAVTGSVRFAPSCACGANASMVVPMPNTSRTTPPREGERVVDTVCRSRSAASVGVSAGRLPAVVRSSAPSLARHSLMRAMMCSRVAFATPGNRDSRTASTVSSSPTVCTAYGSRADRARAVRPELRSGVDSVAWAASSSFDSSGCVVASRAKIATQAARSASAV